MGNVQCCASGRFQEGKPPKKPKTKGKKKEKSKISAKNNGVGGGKGDGSVERKVMAEDSSERAAPAGVPVEALTQTTPAVDVPHDPIPQGQPNDQNPEITDTDNDGLRNESMAEARERFFTQVSNHKYCEILAEPDIFIHLKMFLYVLPYISL